VPDPPAPPADIFNASWETATGTSDAALLDGTVWTAWGGSLASVQNANARYGQNAIRQTNPANAAYLPNGPAFRVGFETGPVRTQRLWFRWWMYYSPNWTWGNNEHKCVILQDAVFAQTIYFNVFSNGVRGGTGHVRIVLPYDTVNGLYNYDAFNLPIALGRWLKCELEVLPGTGTAGQVRCWLDDVLGALPAAALAADTGANIKAWKWDNTYNDYQWVVTNGQTIYCDCDGFAVSSLGRIAS
jgi:hypothetical protein